MGTNPDQIREAFEDFYSRKRTGDSLEKYVDGEYKEFRTESDYHLFNAGFTAALATSAEPQAADVERIYKIRLSGTVNEVFYFDNKVEADFYVETYDRKVAKGEADWSLSLSTVNVPKSGGDFAAFLSEYEK